MTADANEINLLDTGQLRGWERTGVRFLAYTSQRPGTNPVCRFYLSPPRPDTHFYSGKPSECDDVRRRFPDWTYESPAVFYIALPNEFTSACPAGTRPIWRFFNTRVTNHRYTPEVTIRDELRNTPGWTAEGDGPDEVVMCSPTSS
jgi:hypothetical protein